MTAEFQNVVVCRLLDGEEMRGIAQAALEETIALVTLDEPPPEEEFVLELHAPGTRPVVIIAIAAGEPLEPMYPVRVRPFDDEHYGQLLAFVCSQESQASQPVTRWSQGIDRAPSLLRLDTIRDQAVELGPTERISAPGPDPLLGRMLASDKYRIESMMGEGSAGAVYRGRHVALDKALAIKVLHPRFRADETFARRFLAEAKAASRLDHPNVTRVQDFGEEPDGLLYIVMELLRGVDLRQLIHANELPRDRFVEILISVLNALAAADDKSIVHRDIKPENVMVVESRDEEGEIVDVVKVCDFGLATVKPRVAGGTDIRQAAAAMSWVAGTPEYMSPEQILGEDLDIRADLYACGVILFELLTGQLPFQNPSVMHLMRQQLYDPPPRLRSIDPTIDARLEALVLRVLSKDRTKRPETPREFRNELREATRATRNATTHGYLPSNQAAPSAAPAPAPRTLPAMKRARENPAISPEQIADRILSDVPSVLNALTGEATAQQFVQRLRAIVSSFPVLIERGAISVLADIAATLSAMAQEQSSTDDPRPALATRALEPLRHETSLIKIAQAFLAGPDTTRDDARFLLSLGDTAGVRAVLDARRQLARRNVNRSSFVALLRTYGPHVAEQITAGLSAALDERSDPNFLEDLLLALPAQRNIEFRTLGNRLAHHGAFNVRRAVVQRLPDLLGTEAHRILRASTRDPDELVRSAAIKSLRQIGGVDEAVVGLARDLLTGHGEGSMELQIAVADALQDVVPEYRAEAAALLTEALVPRSRSFMNVLLKGSAAVDDTPVLVAVARALLSIAGMDGRRAVERRAAASKSPLRDELEQLLR